MRIENGRESYEAKAKTKRAQRNAKKRAELDTWFESKKIR